MNYNLQMIAQLPKADLKRLKEHDFQLAVYRYAEQQGWKVYTVKSTGFMGKSGKWQAMTQGGWPDMFMIRDGVAVAAELKREIGGKAGEPRQDQQEWLDAIRSVEGAQSHLWKPHDSAEILRILK